MKRLSAKQLENLQKHNKAQQAQREARRQKVCAWCSICFVDTSKRLTQRTCSEKCAREWGVAKRKDNGSYERTEKQNKKMVQSLQQARKEGRWKISKEKRKKLSKQLKERWSSGQMYSNCVKTSLKNYGVAHPMKSAKVKENLKKAFFKKYGVEWATQSPEVKEKTKKTLLEKGLSYQFENKTMKEWANDLGVSYTYFKQVVNEQGFEVAKKLSLSKTGIEATLEEVIREVYGGSFQYDSTLFKQYRPDFLLPKEKLIIECDGLAWHCDRIIKNKLYHKNKKQFYSEQGYHSLFFRSDEIGQKLTIVKSIIRNKLCLNKQRYFARKLAITKLAKEEARDFLSSAHLMGPGRGRSYALVDGNEIISVMQVKWKNKKSKILEIARFCSLPNVSVVGGYSKLIKFVESEERPRQIITFIDERYGSGNYLINLGFKKKKTNVSFKWTDGRQTFNRMQFKGNSGYQKGLYKIWDCGQTPFVKEIYK